MPNSTSENLQVLFEDNHIIAINKRPGDIVQGDKTGDRALSDLVKEYLKDKYNKPGNVYLGVVHRIDRPTSGVVLFTRTSKAAARLSELFREKQVEKNYWAIVEGTPKKPKNKLVHFLKKNAKQNKSYAESKPAKGYKEAILTYQTLTVGDNFSMLSVNIETGRHHQIRCQLSAIGHIVKGDLKYGAKRSNKDGSISLHARSIAFEHPVKKTKLEIIAPTPDESVWNSLEKQYNSENQRGATENVN